jgi:hypothetical protein
MELSLMNKIFCIFFTFVFILLFSCQKKQNLEDNNIDDVISSNNMTEGRIENKEINMPVYKELPYYKAYQFDSGYYYMLDYPVRIRSEPNLDSETIGMLGINSRIKIISAANLDSALEIDGVGALWYEIEYEDITGYIWGGYVSAKTLIHDIDNNGIDDYFHFRVSAIQGPHYYYVNAMDDVVIYLNNVKISTEDIYVVNTTGEMKRVWGTAYFEATENNTVLITMYTGMEDYICKDIFEMDSTGKIELIEQFYESFEEED